MKNTLALVLMVFGIVGCSIYDTGGFTGTRTESLLMAGYTMEQINKAKADGTFNDLVYYARSSGQVKRGYQRFRQEQSNIQAQRAEEARQNQYNAYINQKKATCKSYGYTESNGMAQCVEREINAERARLNAQAAQQNRINQENFQRQQQGLRDLADIFGKMGEGNYGQQQQEKPEKVCVYRCNFDTVTTTDFICPSQITYKGSVCYQD